MVKNEKLSPGGAVYGGGSVETSNPQGASEPVADTDRPSTPVRNDETARRGRDAAAGDRQLTFDQIVRKYETRVYNLILRLVNDPEDARDLTQETFVNAWRSWGRFRGDAQVYTWLYQIAYNNCKNWFKSKDRRRDREPISLDDTIETDSGELSREVADWRAAPENLLLSSELSQQIQKAVDALAPEYREILVLAQWEDLSYEEIARITDLSVPAVKTRLHRARQKVQRRLEPYYRGWVGRER